MKESWFSFCDRNVQFEPSNQKWYGCGRPFKRKGQARNYAWKQYKKINGAPGTDL